MKHFLLAGLLSTAAVGAQTSTTVLNLSWTAPTLNTDGSAIVGTLVYNLYQGTKGGTFTKTGTAIAGSSTVVTSATAGSCFAVTAVETVGSSTMESVPSAVVCALQPNAPGALTVAVTITVHSP